jgi:hypothetical protein
LRHPHLGIITEHGVATKAFDSDTFDMPTFVAQARAVAAVRSKNPMLTPSTKVLRL